MSCLALRVALVSLTLCQYVNGFVGVDLPRFAGEDVKGDGVLDLIPATTDLEFSTDSKGPRLLREKDARNGRRLHGSLFQYFGGASAKVKLDADATADASSAMKKRHYVQMFSALVDTAEKKVRVLSGASGDLHCRNSNTCRYLRSEDAKKWGKISHSTDGGGSRASLFGHGRREVGLGEHVHYGLPF
eukprot:jgi/Botrbrau1/15133/Bobra.0149s0005.1